MATFRSKIKNFPYPASDLQSDSRPRGELYVPDDVMLAASVPVLVGPNGGVLGKATASGGMKVGFDSADDPYTTKELITLIPERTDIVDGVTDVVSLSGLHGLYLIANASALVGDSGGLSGTVEIPDNHGFWLEIGSFVFAEPNTPYTLGIGSVLSGNSLSLILRVTFTLTGTITSATWYIDAYVA